MRFLMSLETFERVLFLDYWWFIYFGGDWQILKICDMLHFIIYYLIHFFLATLLFDVLAEFISTKQEDL